jgi:hypothetical protein
MSFKDKGDSVFMNGNYITYVVFKKEGEVVFSMPISHLKIPQINNVRNVCPKLKACMALGRLLKDLLR